MSSSEERKNRCLFSHYEDGGTGFYGKNAGRNKKLIQDATPLLIQALDIATETTKGLYTICDFGTADGVVSMTAMKNMIEFIRNKRKNSQIKIIFEDLPNNNFKPIFLGIHGLIEHQYGSSNEKDYRDVFMSVVGTSFFDQCVPDNSIDLGMSSVAMMWLSKLPCPLTGTTHHRLTAVEEEKNEWKTQAAKDWETLLLLRSKELVPGGQMVIISLGIFHDWLKNDETHFHEYVDSLLERCVQEEIITKEEFHNMNILSYYRTEEEYKEPFKDSESSVSQAGLSLEYFKMIFDKCPHKKQWEEQGKKGDEKKYATEFSASIRRWLNSPLFEGLSETRPLEERKTIIDKIFTLFEADIECAPEHHFRDYSIAVMHISKRL